MPETEYTPFLGEISLEYLPNGGDLFSLFGIVCVPGNRKALPTVHIKCPSSNCEDSFGEQHG